MTCNKENVLDFDQNRAIIRGSVSIDLETLVAKRGRQKVALTEREADILGFATGTVSRLSIADRINLVFGERVSTIAVSVYMGYLRRKLGNDIFINISKRDFRVNDQAPPSNT